MTSVSTDDSGYLLDARDVSVQFGGVKALNGVTLRVRGVRPTVGGLFRWLALRQSAAGTIVPSLSTAILYQGVGTRHDR